MELFNRFDLNLSPRTKKLAIGAIYETGNYATSLGGGRDLRRTGFGDYFDAWG